MKKKTTKRAKDWRTGEREIQWEDLTREEVIGMCDPSEVDEKLAALGFATTEGEDQ